MMGQGKSQLVGKIVIVTGASRGIGRETALAFARAGASVAVVARNAAALREVVESSPELGERLLAVPADVTRAEDVGLLFSRTIERFGRVDILVNNAGLGMRANIATMQMGDVRQLLEINFFGVVRCIQTALPHMRRQGRGQIVNVGSVLSVVATARNSAYCASKFALLALTNSLRTELRGSGIEVISVLPGYTDTPFFDHMIRYDGSARLSPFKGQHPGKVARAIVRACVRHKREVALTWSGRAGIWMKRFAPGILDIALRRSV